jgi:hypothetical protein
VGEAVAAVRGNVAANWRRKPGRRGRDGMVEPGWLSELLSGTCGADVATAGFLASVQVIAETLGAPAGVGEALIT